MRRILDAPGLAWPRSDALSPKSVRQSAGAQVSCFTLSIAHNASSGLVGTRKRAAKKRRELRSITQNMCKRDLVRDGWKHHGSKKSRAVPKTDLKETLSAKASSVEALIECYSDR